MESDILDVTLVNIVGNSLSFPITAGTLETESITAQKIPTILAIPPIDKMPPSEFPPIIHPQIRNSFFRKYGSRICLNAGRAR